MHRYAVDDGAKLCVGVVQPNIDPWEKWGSDAVGKWESYDQQFHTLLAESKKLVIDSSGRRPQFHFICYIPNILHININYFPLLIL